VQDFTPMHIFNKLTKLLFRPPENVVHFCLFTLEAIIAKPSHGKQRNLATS